MWFWNASWNENISYNMKARVVKWRSLTHRTINIGDKQTWAPLPCDLDSVRKMFAVVVVIVQRIKVHARNRSKKISLEARLEELWRAHNFLDNFTAINSRLIAAKKDLSKSLTLKICCFMLFWYSASVNEWESKNQKKKRRILEILLKHFLLIWSRFGWLTIMK